MRAPLIASAFFLFGAAALSGACTESYDDLFLGTASTTSSSASSGSGGDGGGGPCTAATDCPGNDTECQTRVCTAGTCDVANAAAGTSCTGMDNEKVCDGGGSCVECNDNNDCSAPLECNAANKCGDLLANGEACGMAVECASGICTDGVCCDTACDGLCEACVLSKTGKLDGTCGGVSAGTDPDSECADEGVASCGVSGDGCSGTPGACNVYDDTTVCVAGGCNSTTNEQAGDSLCDGAGTCVAASPTSCGNYVCDSGGAVCQFSCAGGAAGDASCSATAYCPTASNQCVPKKANGSNCSETRECTSGFCIDGLCCDTACDQLCESCAQTQSGGLDGTCTLIPSGQDPGDECNSPPTRTCDGAGMCMP